MLLPLNTLRILLSVPEEKIVVNGSVPVYRWPCGCIASGWDEASLDTAFCDTHERLYTR